MSITQKKRAKMIAECYKQWGINGDKALDVGCGNGVVSQVLKQKLGLDIYGTDIINYLKIDISFKKMKGANQLPFNKNSFDYVMFNDVLHHLADHKYIKDLILEAKRISKSILIFEDVESPLLKLVDVGLNYFYSRHMPCPLNFKTEDEWCKLFKKLELKYEIGKITYPFWYPFKHMAFKLT